jgi:hypothetical protein
MTAPVNEIQMTLLEHSHDRPSQNANHSSSNPGLFGGPALICKGPERSNVSDLQQETEVKFLHGPRFATRVFRQLKIKDWLNENVGPENDAWKLQRLGRMPGGLTVEMVCFRDEADMLLCHMVFMPYLTQARKIKRAKGLT